MKKEILEQINQDNPVTKGSTALVYKQETLEEAAEKYIETSHYMNLNPIEYIKFGAKWQQEQNKNESTADYIDRHIVQAMVETAKQRMYSQEEVLSILKQTEVSKTSILQLGITKWFEKFKKK